MSEEEAKRPSVGKRNKSAGHAWELKIVKRLKEIGYLDVASSRAVSRLRDAQKVDVCNKDESVSGRLPYNIQAKTYSKNVPYPKILAEMPVGKETNVIFLRQTERSGTRFIASGTYAILPLDSFYEMMQKIMNLEKEHEEHEDTITLKTA